MRVVRMGSWQVGRIDPKGENRRKSEREREISRETPLLWRILFQAKKEPQGGFPYGQYTTTTSFWVAGN
jgi:hypothetical protein